MIEALRRLLTISEKFFYFKRVFLRSCDQNPGGLYPLNPLNELEPLEKISFYYIGSVLIYHNQILFTQLL